MLSGGRVGSCFCPEEHLRPRDKLTPPPLQQYPEPDTEWVGGGGEILPSCTEGKIVYVCVQVF